MAFTLLSTTLCERGIKTVIQLGGVSGALFQVRSFNVSATEVRIWGWLYAFWDTGNPDVGRVIISQTALYHDRNGYTAGSVPEGVQGLMIYIPEKAPLDSYLVALYRRS